MIPRYGLQRGPKDCQCGKRIKVNKISLNQTLDKPLAIKKEQVRKLYEDKLSNHPYFKPVIAPKRKLGTWGKASSPFKGPLLHVSLTKVVQRMKQVNQVNWPQSMRAPFRNSNKYYTFHKDTGHWTKGYIHLKWKIEHLLSKRHMVDLVNGNRNPRKGTKSWVIP